MPLRGIGEGKYWTDSDSDGMGSEEPEQRGDRLCGSAGPLRYYPADL